MIKPASKRLDSIRLTRPAERPISKPRRFPHWAGLVEYAPHPKHRLLAQRVFKLFEEVVLPRLPSLEMQVIHGDYAPNNVVVDPHSDVFVAAILDFGDTVHSAMIFDPANTVAHLIGRSQDHPWQDAFAFVAGYEAEPADKGVRTSTFASCGSRAAHHARVDQVLEG
ncbi:phosphotransferase [Mesorhizobium sp. L103C131B0]|uniref:phosphotransferase enzyme family protein n=1 Tax=Mesorhizobium sp. L103C131B0 TaxID=1287089 RepID=UPI0032AFA8D5